VALGPWSDDVFRPLGYEIPLAVKRGYHMHYPVPDADGGFALAPMIKGIRLTTGVEFHRGGRQRTTGRRGQTEFCPAGNRRHSLTVLQTAMPWG
jgi:hypothetical protein